MPRSTLRLRLRLRLVTAAPLLLASALASTGCSDLGTHTLTIAGSDRVVQGLSTFDEWDVTFDQFVVVVHNPGLIERVDNRPTHVREAGVTVWDVTAEVGDDEALSRMIRATRYDGAEFRIGPPSFTGYEAEPGNVDEGLVDKAVEDDWSIRVVGSATNAMNQTVTFDWTFATNTRYRCTFDGDEVVELGAEGDETTVIEIWGEALLREMGQEQNFDAELTFDPIAAADSDTDGEVTQAELEAAGQWERLEQLTREFGAIQGSFGCGAQDD